MDHYSFAELTELYFLARADADTQFQFWIWITFAVIVATFAAGEKLSRRLRYLAAALYLLATKALVILFAMSAIGSARIAATITEADANPLGSFPSSLLLVVVGARWLLFIAGTAAALFFLLRHAESESQGRVRE